MRIELGALKYAEGSVLIEMGDTKVLVSASVERRVPPLPRDTGKWLGHGRVRDAAAGDPHAVRAGGDPGAAVGPHPEIQRLIGRSLRSVVDLTALGENTITVDCDVLQADGGTRTAAITGAYVALAQAVARCFWPATSTRWPLRASSARYRWGWWTARRSSTWSTWRTRRPRST